MKRQEQELLVSKEKVFAKWQEYLDKSELVEGREAEIKRLIEQVKVREAELDLKAR